MSIREFKEVIIKLNENLEREYKSAPGKPWLTLAGVTILLTFLGMYYLWVYFDNYQMIGFATWTVNDAYTLLFNNLMPMIYLAVILSFYLLILIPGIIKNKRQNQLANNSLNERSHSSDSLGLSNMSIIIFVLLIHVGFYILLQVYAFGPMATCVFLGGMALASYLYLKISPKVGVGLAILMAFFYANVRANRDVQVNEKIRPKINLTLSAYSKDPILTQDDTCKYIIYSTDGFYYIKDDCEKKIYAFSVSGDELKSMSVK